MSHTKGRRRRGGAMTIGAHLTELRKRLVRAAAAILAATLAGWFLSDLALGRMREPILQAATDQDRLAQLNYDSITSAFDLKIQVAVTIGIVLASPVWLYQIWAFFAPALTRKELKYAVGFFASAVPLFLAGCVAGWLVVPHIVLLMTGFASHEDSSFIQAADYFTFVLKLVLVVGVAFVLPVFLVLLNFVGVIEGRTILASWRPAVIAIVLFTAIATPSADVVSMFILAVPMLMLYVAAGGIAIAHDHRARRAVAQLAQQITV